MKHCAMWCVILCCSLQVHGQPRTITFQDSIIYAGVDRTGELYVLTSKGDVSRYDQLGHLTGSFHFNEAPALFEPLDGVLTFWMAPDRRQYGMLNSTLTETTRLEIDPSFAVTPHLICPSLKELWILDGADLSLKKTRMKSSAIFLESALKHLPDKKASDYTYLREYQNYLFLLDRQAGVHMLNGIGRLVRTMGRPGMLSFSFLGEEMYYIDQNKLVLIDLYTGEQRSFDLPVQGVRFALLNDDHLFAVGRSTLTIVPFRVN